MAKFGNNEPIANPSRPSVRFTALLQATRMKIAQGIKKRPKAGRQCLKKGKTSSVENGVKKTRQKTTIAATRSCNLNLQPEEMPF